MPGRRRTRRSTSSARSSTRCTSEGRYELRPDATHGGSQALALQPAQGGFVEFSLAEKGLYPIVTHKFSNVGKGALGLFQAGDVDTSAAAGGH